LFKNVKKELEDPHGSNKAANPNYIEDPHGSNKAANGLISLCIHPWTVKPGAVRCVIDKYVQIISTLVWCLDDANFRKILDKSHSAEVRWMLNQCTSFSFFFALHTCICLFEVMDKYSKMFQANDVTVSSAVYIIKCCREDLLEINAFDDAFDEFWDCIQNTRDSLNTIISTEE
jgi:hypothetical protein